MGQPGGGHQGGVADADAVVDLVALLQAAQDGDGVLQRRLVHQHRLEPALQRLVLLDVLAVFVQRGGAHAAKLAPRQRRLQHVGRVHRPLGPAGAHQGVQLVDEQDDLPLGRGDLLQHRLQAVLELAPVLGAGDEGAQIQRQDALVLQRLGHVAGRDALGDALHDGGLADARLADQHRVVLGPSGQHLHRPPHLLVAADDRVQLSLSGHRRQVAGVFGQRLVAPLGLGVGHALGSTHLGQRLQQPIPGDAQLGQRPGGGAEVLADQRQQQVLARDVFVLELLRLLGRLLQEFLQAAADVDVGGGAAHLRLLLQRFIDAGADRLGFHPQLAQQCRDDAVVLADQRAQHVLGADFLMVAAAGQIAGRRQGFLRLDGEFFEPHGC